MGAGGTGAPAGTRGGGADRRARRAGLQVPGPPRRRSRSRTRGGGVRGQSLRCRLRATPPERGRLHDPSATAIGKNPPVADARSFLDLTLAEWLDELAGPNAV